MKNFICVIISAACIASISNAHAANNADSPYIQYQDIGPETGNRNSNKKDNIYASPAAGGNSSRFEQSASEMSTDRARNTQEQHTVGKYRLQLETSFDFLSENDFGATQRRYAFPTTIRFGLFENLDLNMSGNMFIFNTVSTGGNTSGFGDLFFGSKWAIVEGGGVLPSLGLAGRLGLPIGSNSVSGNTFLPEVTGIFGWHLPWELQLDSNIGFDLPPKDIAGDRFVRLTYGVAIEKALPVLEERLNTFLEVAGRAPLKSGKAGPHQLGAGVGFKLNERIEFDTFARLGLNKAAPDFQTGLGFSWLIR